MTKYLTKVTIFSAISALIGAFSLFSMAQEIWQFGLSAVLLDFVEYYRTLAGWIFGWIGWPWSWRISQGLCDYLALQSLCAGILIRSGAISNLTVRSSDDSFRSAGMFSRLLLLLTPLGVMICYGAPFGVLMSPFKEEGTSGLSFRVLPFVLLSIVALIVLFALNAYGLSANSL